MVIRMNLIKKDRNNKIQKSREIIKKEKKKIKEEKEKIKEQKLERFYKSKFGKNIKKFQKRNFIQKEDPKCESKKMIKEKILSVILFEVMGAIICLIILFILSGGKNFIKLYGELNKLINVYDTITTSYYGNLDKNNMIDNAVNSMLSEVGDEYTNYSSKSDASSFLETVDGVYEGIGCMVSMDENNNIVIINIFDNSPAKKAGLKEKDIILKIDNQDYQGKTSNDMSNYVKNSKASKIKLTIKRDEEEKEITVNRRKVEVPSISSEILEKDNKKVGYIDISVFSAVTYEQFKKELTKLEKKGIHALIIDVRNDSGGYLSAVTDISSLFLKKGKIIYQLEDNNKKEIIKDKTKENRTYPIAVLVNKNSASASEILASAIKESYGGYVVGTQTYGKGTVQKTKKLSDGSMIKYTIQKWLTPNNNWIDKEGVKPTNAVEYEIKDNVDLQLEKALELVSK